MDHGALRPDEEKFDAGINFNLDFFALIISI